MLQIPVFAAHSHNADCYGGTLHICSGNSTSGGACYTARQQSCQGKMTYKGLATVTFKCASCGKENGTGNKFSASCSACSFTGIAYDDANGRTCSCGGNIIPGDETIRLKSSCPNVFTVYDKTCNKVSGEYYNSQGQKLSPNCQHVVTSIKAKNPTQTTDSPDFTLIATYLDGHTAEIQPTSVNFNVSKTYNNEPVTLTYNGTINKVGNIASLTTTITLTSKTPAYTTPTPRPTGVITVTPTNLPTQRPIVTPTPRPTIVVTPTVIVETPTPTPTKTPTQNPTPSITETPTKTPTTAPTENPVTPSVSVDLPSIETPTPTPTEEPTKSPDVEIDEDGGIIIPPADDTTLSPTPIEDDDISESDDDDDKDDDDKGAIGGDNKDDGGNGNDGKDDGKKTSLATIFLILFSVVFALLLITTIVVVIIQKSRKNKPVNKINLNDYMRRY